MMSLPSFFFFFFFFFSFAFFFSTSLSVSKTFPDSKLFKKEMHQEKRKASRSVSLPRAPFV